MSTDPAAYSPRGGQAWVLRSRELLQQSADELDGATRSRLNRARQAALDGLTTRSRSADRLRWWGGAAITCGLALVLWQVLPREIAAPHAPATPIAAAPMPTKPAPAPSRFVPTPVSAPDFELLADAQQFALVEELEFYAWLESAEASDG